MSTIQGYPCFTHVMTNDLKTLNFSLDPRLKADTLFLCKMGLCQVRVMNDSRFSWLVLIPEITDACEMMDLSPPLQTQLFHEIMQASDVLKQKTDCDKINIAAFGNMVSQLHVHIVARFKTDPAWPGSAIGWPPPTAWR